MGTRADFYVSKPAGLEWLGSIGWDGMEIDHVSLASTEEQYRQCVEEFFQGRDDVTRPELGWPWPWNDSRLTDYAYVFVDGIGVVYRDGDNYPIGVAAGKTPYKPDNGKCRRYVSKRLMDDPPADWVFDDYWGYEKLAAVDCFYIYPDMSGHRRVRMDAGSGMICITASATETAKPKQLEPISTRDEERSNKAPSVNK